MPRSPIGATNVMRTKTLSCSVLLACSFLILVALSSSADDKKDKASLSGVWALKGAEMKMEFAEKNVLKMSPHGDSNLIVIICEYTAEKEGLVKAKITDFEGKDEAKKQVKDLLPVGTEFSFKWKVKDDAAKLDDVKGDKVDALKSHLEGDYEQKK
jgi:hypothetical protein